MNGGWNGSTSDPLQGSKVLDIAHWILFLYLRTGILGSTEHEGENETLLDSLTVVTAPD